MHHGIVFLKMASSDSDSAFEVDTILKQRKRKGILEYLVRWRDFEQEQDSWEPANHLKHCPEAITTFIKLNTKTKSRSKTRSRSRSRSRATKKSPKSKTKTSPSRSRSRSSSRGRKTEVTKKEPSSPSRQSRRTEVTKKTSTNKSAGRTEKVTEVIKKTTNDINPSEKITTKVVQSKIEVKTIEAELKPKKSIDVASIGTYFHDIWQTIDTAVLILFICLAIFLLSYVVEQYISPTEVTGGISGFFSGIKQTVQTSSSKAVNAVVSSWQYVVNATGNAWSKVTKN